MRREDIDNAEIERLYYGEGWNQHKIADYYGTSQPTIHYRLHPEKQKEVKKEYRKKHPEADKDYYEEHKEQKKASNKKWRKKHPEYQEYTNKKTKEWHEKHPGYGRDWWHTENGMVCRRKKNARRRSLGCIELNKPFLGDEGHHIDKIHIVYIPAKLHKSIGHNVFSGKGMEEINEIAFEYITEEAFKKLMEGEIPAYLSFKVVP